MKRFITVSILLLFFILPCFSQEEMSHEQTVKKADVPKAVITAFGKAYPKAKVKGYSKETDEGKIVYEIESKEGSLARDVSYDGEGNVVSIEETLPFSSLPHPVQDAVHKQFPISRAAKCEKVQEGATIHYEIVLRSGTKRQEVVFDADGKVVKKEAAKAEDKD